MKVYLNLQTAALTLDYIAVSNFHLLKFPRHLENFLSKVASRLAASFYAVQDSAPY